MTGWPSRVTRTAFRTLLGTMDRPFVVLAVAARLPTAMLPLGILLYVADRIGSHAMAERSEPQGWTTSWATSWATTMTTLLGTASVGAAVGAVVA